MSYGYVNDGMTQVRSVVLSEGHDDDLEKVVNDWLASHSNVELLDMKFAMHAADEWSWYAVLVLYRERIDTEAIAE